MPNQKTTDHPAGTSLLDGQPGTEMVHGEIVELDVVDAEIVEPTIHESAVAVSLIRPDDSWDGVDDGDLSPGDGVTAIPMLTLNRKLDGGFVEPDTGAITQELDVILLAKQKTRAWFSAPFGSKESKPLPDCWSGDGERPDDRSTQKMADTCAACPLSQWDDGDPPKCKESLITLAFVPDPGGQGRFVRIRWGGIAFAPLRDYWLSYQNRLPKRPPLAYITHIKLEKADTANGAFLKPVFSRGEELKRFEVQPIIDERDARLPAFKELTAGDALARDVDPEPFATASSSGSDDESEPF